jgi:hypothetical protein
MDEVVWAKNRSKSKVRAKRENRRGGGATGRIRGKAR